MLECFFGGLDFGGLNGGDDGGDGGGFGWSGFFFFFLHHFFDQAQDWAFVFVCLAYFGAWGEDTEFGVRDDLFYGFDWF
jgi:hypothetical protein